MSLYAVTLFYFLNLTDIQAYHVIYSTYKQTVYTKFKYLVNEEDDDDDHEFTGNFIVLKIVPINKTSEDLCRDDLDVIP